MPESNILAQIEAMPPDQFERVCQKIVTGLGFEDPHDISISEIPVIFRETIERRSTDGMFRTKESWLLAFFRSEIQFSVPDLIQPLINVFRRQNRNVSRREKTKSEYTPGNLDLEMAMQKAQEAGVQNILVVVFGNLNEKDVEEYHSTAKKIGLRSVLLSQDFAQALLQDYAASEIGPATNGPFSFAGLRERMKQQAQKAPWHEQFLSLAALPIHVSKLYRKRSEEKPEEIDIHQSVLSEADLFGAIYKSPSFLLLGDPGAGKTTCLQELAEELAATGARTPVLLPLNQYEGNLLRDLGGILCKESDLLSEQEIKSLLSSGALTIILDGLNEVQSQTLQSKLIKDINTLTNPESPTARSHWIASSRRYDYHYAPQLSHLDQYTWELLPLDSSLIYQFLIDGLGEIEGEAAYVSLNPSLRDVCSNPLLLNMLVNVLKKSEKISAAPGTLTRGTLYYQFIDLLLHRGVDQPVFQRELENLSEIIGSNLTIDMYRLLAYPVLSHLANTMQERGTTVIGSNEALDVFKQYNSTLVPGGETATRFYGELLQGLLYRGILKFTAGRIVFFHHTFQEYFYAEKLKEQPLENLIPRNSIISGADREVIFFVSSTLESADALQNLIDLVLKSRGNSYLAYEIISSTSVVVSEEVLLKIARSLWHQVSAGGGYVGANKRSAQALIYIAKRLDQPVYDLLLDILMYLDERDFDAHLLNFYQEVGDITAQQQLLKEIDSQEDISDDLLFRIAMSVSESGDQQKTIELYTELIEKSPNNADAYYGNRAIAYKKIGNRKKAEEDYKRSISINPKSAITRTNYAMLLIEDEREEQALEELRIAIENNPEFEGTYFELGKLLKTKDLRQALFHLEKAVNLTGDTHKQAKYLEELLDVQEKLGRFAGGMISIKRLIDLQPTSRRVNQWKKKYAYLRSKYEDEQRESGETLLGDLARTVLHAIGWHIDHARLQWIRAVSDKPELVSPLLVLLLDIPQLTKDLVQQRIEELQNEEKEIKYVLLLTTADAVDREARIYLVQRTYPITLITSAELREATMASERYVHQLVINAITRSTQRGNTFKYLNLVRERSEFFGREQQKDDFTTLILQHGHQDGVIGLYGIHKIGKSSLLRQVHQHLAVYAQHITPIWIEMSAAIKNPSDLYRGILRELYGKTKEFGQQPLSSEQFQHELYTFWKSRQRDHAKYQILLILDEYPYLLPGKSGGEGIADFMEVLGLFKVMSQEGWFNFLPCGRTTALSRIAQWQGNQNPFIGKMQEHFLGPLAKEEVEELIRVLGIKAGLDFRDDAIERMWELAGGHPFFTRALGSSIFERDNKSSRRTSISASMVDDAVKTFLRSGSEIALLRKIYQEELEDEEQRIVKKLAISGRPLPRNAFVSDNASEEERKQTSIAINNLLATSVLKDDKQKRLSHQYELLRLVIIQDMEEDDLYTKKDLEDLTEPYKDNLEQNIRETSLDSYEARRRKQRRDILAKKVHLLPENDL